MGYGTQHPHSRKEHTALYNISKFGVNQANIRKDTAIQKLQILLRNVWNAGHTTLAWLTPNLRMLYSGYVGVESHNP